jgi:DNA polymerase I-like protein with 3'-5' exonuclease and polymerase domains
MTKKNYTIIQSHQQYLALLKHIEESDYLAFDTETTGLNPRKSKVIGLSLSGKIGTAFYLPRLSWYEGALHQQCEDEYFVEVLKLLTKKDLLTWNGSFDVRMVKSNFDIDLTDSLIADIQMMKHTLDEEPPFALKEVAVLVQDKIGFNVEELANQEQIELKENVTKNGGSTTKDNYEMYKADLDVLGKYACSDADLTLRLAEYYKQKLEQEDLWDFFFEEEVMPLYREVTIPMESYGVRLDMDFIHDNYKKLKDKITYYESKVKESLCDTDAFKRWLKDRLDDKCPISTKGNFAQKVVERFNIPLPKTSVGKYSVTKKLLLPYAETNEGAAFLLGLCRLKPYDVEAIQREMLVQKDGDIINISSKDHLSSLCFNYMGLKASSKTKSGKDQFDQDYVQGLSDKHEWANYLNVYNKLSKIKSSYYDRILEGHDDGYYYFGYKQHGTVSGRYSSDAQQMPRPITIEECDNEDIVYFTNTIRAFFIVDEGHIFIDSDYTSLEPHVFSHVSTDERLRDIFRKGLDFYSTVAIFTEKLHQYSANPKDLNYLGKVNKPKRQSSKKYSLGIPYGMSAYALAMALGISKEEGYRLHKGYLEGFPDLAQWMESSEEMAKNLGYVVTLTGRVRHLPKVKDLYNRFGDKLLDFKFRKKLESNYGSDQVKNWYMDYKNGLNNAKNVQIQGLSASIVNRAAIAVTRAFKKHGIEGRVCAQVHDQLIFDVVESQKEEAAKISQDCMENVVKLSVQLKAPPCFSYNWRDGH